jgi:murein DD-endopeptidase MepM/ murein hydrolase activator NlpD
MRSKFLSAFLVVVLPVVIFSQTELSFSYPVGDQYGNGWLLNKSGYQFLDYATIPCLVYHPGIDFNKDGTSGDEDLGQPVYAVADGIVVYSDYVTGSTWGNLISIKHLLPDGSNVFSVYGHLLDRQVQNNAIVKNGDIIGHVGKGDGSLSAHLHFEIRKSNMSSTSATYYPCGQSQQWVSDHYYDPKAFINARNKFSSVAFQYDFSNHAQQG